MFSKLITYFMRGTVIVLPVTLTIYILYEIIKYLDGLLDDVIKIDIPGLGLVIILSCLTVVGYFSTGLLGKPLVALMDWLMERTPGIKFIYKSIKDMLEAFVGEKKKFKEPVMVEMSDTGVYKLGFITEKELAFLAEEENEQQMEQLIAVYFPHSYNFSGNLFVVQREKVVPIKGNSSELMKFIVSGGVVEMQEKS